MAPFRPQNLNKRAYPGNANVIGPTVQATVGLSTTTVCSSTNVCGACACQTPLGCRCFFCACPCCDICCSCLVTTCTSSVPSGMWSSSEQYEASTRNAWGSGITTTAGLSTCLCSTNAGYACTTNSTDCKGFFSCCGPGTVKWFVSPDCAQYFPPGSPAAGDSWESRGTGVTCANTVMGSCGWFIAGISTMYGLAQCGSYWSYPNGQYGFWSDTLGSCINGYQYAWITNMQRNCQEVVTFAKNIAARAVRCTAT